MKITEKLREAGEKSIDQVREGWQETRENLQDVQRRLRQRMRIFPRRKNGTDETATPLLARTIPVTENQEDKDASVTQRGFKGIQLRPAKSIFSRRGKNTGGEPAS